MVIYRPFESTKSLTIREILRGMILWVAMVFIFSHSAILCGMTVGGPLHIHIYVVDFKVTLFFPDSIYSVTDGEFR